MSTKSNKIKTVDLHEESRRLHEIIVRWRNSPEPLFDLEQSISDWANSLLLAASDNEPGQVRLLPGPDWDRMSQERKSGRLFDPAIIQKLEDRYKDTPVHQSIGSGSTNFVQGGKHQKI